MPGRFLFVALVIVSPLIVAPYYAKISKLAEMRLHTIAKSHIKVGNHQTALQCYQTAAEHGNDRRSHLLLVLHMQRCGAPKTHTRDAFRCGLLSDPDDATLLQAWALYESKLDNMHRAVHLLRRAVRVDRSAIGALRWKKFKTYNRNHNPLARPSKRGLAPNAKFDA